MRRTLFLAALLVSPVLGSPAAHAGEVTDRAAAAENLMAQGQALAAVTEFEKAQDALWAGLPLTIRRVAQVDSASGVGIYSERGNSTYAPGEKLFLYVEPVGYSFGGDGLGNHVIALAVDMTLKSEAGVALGTIENIGQIKLPSRAKNRELFFSLNLTLEQGSIPAGKYKADFTMRDLNSTKTAAFSIDFEIAG
jgi:hypothetical protein